MDRKGWIVSGVVAVACAIGAASAAQPRPESGAREAGRPATESVVVELFTAQGCSACPDANRTVEALADDPGVIALTYAVDYWDYLGWPDTFARPAFAQRQRDYRTKLQLRNVYTPQVIVDGRLQLSGAEGTAVQAAVDAEAARRAWPPQIEFREGGDSVGIGSGRAPSGGAQIWLVTYRPGAQTVEVTGGDNRGESVRHINVVSDIQGLGDWTGRPVLVDLPEARSDMAYAVLVQGKADGRIIAAATT